MNELSGAVEIVDTTGDLNMKRLLDFLRLNSAQSVQRRKMMEKKKLKLNMEWPDVVGSIGVVVGMLSFFIGAIAAIAMHEATRMDESSLIIFGMFIFGLTVSIVGSGFLVKASAKEMLKDITEEKEKEGEFSVVDCGAEDSCPSVHPASACPSFGTDACPLEHERGDI